jgi:hypothetical protein
MKQIHIHSLMCLPKFNYTSISWSVNLLLKFLTVSITKHCFDISIFRSVAVITTSNFNELDDTLYSCATRCFKITAIKTDRLKTSVKL